MLCCLSLHLSVCLSVCQVGKLSKNKKKKLKRKAKRQQRLLEERLVDIQVLLGVQLGNHGNQGPFSSHADCTVRV